MEENLLREWGLKKQKKLMTRLRQRQPSWRRKSPYTEGSHSCIPYIFDPPAKSKPRSERLISQARSCAHVRLHGRGSRPFSFWHRKQARRPIRGTHREANSIPWKEIRVLLRRGTDTNSSITKKSRHAMLLGLYLDSPFQLSPCGRTTICTALWCFDSTSLPRGCLSFLAAFAAS